jgi:hypothetical protein
MPAGHNNAAEAVNVSFSLPFTPPRTGYYSAATRSCNLVYCHGTILKSDSTAVSTTAPDTAGCSFCHNIPQLQNKTHHTLITNSVFNDCGRCHTGYDLAAKKVADSLHINGKIDPRTCTNACHLNGSPLIDTVSIW